jgi:ubiquinone/menaquinone biosynthesis C-methylase UbiE
MHWTDELFNGLYDSEYENIMADTLRAERESQFVVRELALGKQDRVLDIACGQGRLAFLIAQTVREVVGVDFTERYIQRAKELAQEKKITNIQFIVGDMREMEYDSEFDAAYNYFTSWGYWNDETNQDILRRICRALKPGGRFLLECISRDGLMRRFQPRGWVEFADDSYLLEDRAFDFETGRSTAVRTYITPGGVKKLEISIRLPATEELLKMFHEAGFSSARIVEAPEGGDVTPESYRIAIIGAR